MACGPLSLWPYNLNLKPSETPQFETTILLATVHVVSIEEGLKVYLLEQPQIVCHFKKGQRLCPQLTRRKEVILEIVFKKSLYSLISNCRPTSYTPEYIHLLFSCFPLREQSVTKPYLQVLLICVYYRVCGKTLIGFLRKCWEVADECVFLYLCPRNICKKMRKAGQTRSLTSSSLPHFLPCVG